MALYAVDEDDLIYAGDAEPGKVYWCQDCFGPVKRRRSKSWLPHFYHLKPSRQCRLFSKTEDHLLAQLQLQKQFPPGVIQIERPFLSINRVADACWEAEKVIFEIQCAPMTEKEAEMRMADYRSIHYEVVWLLDDKRYNKRVLRPAEEYLRRYCTYYTTIKRTLTSEYYDQFEIFSERKRVKKGKKLNLDLKNIKKRPATPLDPSRYPKQILDLKGGRYIHNDRLCRALQNHFLTMENWKTLEIHSASLAKKPSRLQQWLQRYFLNPYAAFLEKLIRFWSN